jgi:5-enolpyruvylshikimate-3-phosphate synthase
MPKSNVNHKARIIDVWENAGAHCEREGNSLSVQVRTPKGIAGMVFPLECLQDLQDVLTQAGAISPAGTVTMNIHHPAVDVSGNSVTGP